MVVPRCRSPWGSGACSYRGGISAVPSRRPPTHHQERLPDNVTEKKKKQRNRSSRRHVVVARLRLRLGGWCLLSLVGRVDWRDMHERRKT